jgi:hypothetical protein
MVGMVGAYDQFRGSILKPHGQTEENKNSAKIQIMYLLITSL